MNEPESNAPAQNELRDQMVALQHQVFTLLLGLVVVSGTLAAFLYYQSHMLGKDVAAIKPQATVLIQEFRHDQAGMDAFVKQLAAYGATHPDFQPILKKYGIPLPTAAPVTPRPKK